MIGILFSLLTLLLKIFVVPKQEATRKRAIPANLIKIISELPYRYTVRGEDGQLSLQPCQRLFHAILLFDRHELSRFI